MGDGKEVHLHVGHPRQSVLHLAPFAANGPRGQAAPAHTNHCAQQERWADHKGGVVEQRAEERAEERARRERSVRPRKRRAEKRADARARDAAVERARLARGDLLGVRARGLCAPRGLDADPPLSRG
jgi:hypothetical protein